MYRRSPRANGFTLVELLVVITIIGFLMAMVFPAIAGIFELFNATKCAANQKGIYTALLAYAPTNKDRLPPGVITGERGMNKNGQPNFNNLRKVAGHGQSNAPVAMGPSWLVYALPKLELGPMSQELKKCIPYANHVPSQCSSSEKFKKVGTTIPTFFVCPSSEEIVEDGYMSVLGYQDLAKGTYAANFGTDYFVNDDKNSRDRLKKAGAFEVVSYSVPKNNGVFVKKEFKDFETKKLKGSISRYGGNWKYTPKSKVGVSLKEGSFVDGRDKTILLSEILPLNNSKDVRGAWFYPGMGGASFTAHTVPNAFNENKLELYDHLLTCDDSSPQIGTPLHCEVLSRGDGVPKTYAAARSAHPGKVVAALANGNTVEIDDTIELKVWQALCSRAGYDGGEIGDAIE